MVFERRVYGCTTVMGVVAAVGDGDSSLIYRVVVSVEDILFVHSTRVPKSHVLPRIH